MEWDGINTFNGVPIVGQHRRRSRNAPQFYYEDANGNLIIPGGAGGGAGGFRRGSFGQGSRPTSIVINNSQRDEVSPDRRPRPRRRSSDSRYESSESSDRSREHSRDRRRHRRHSKHYRKKSRSPSADPNMERRLDRLKELERKEEEEEARRRFEEEQVIEEARRAKKKREEEEMKNAAVAEWKQKELEKEIKAKEAKEEADRIYQERVRAEFAAKGYSDESIEEFLKKQQKEDKKKKKHKEHEETLDLSRPRYLKVHTRYLSPDTLDIYELPWEWDEVSFFPFNSPSLIIAQKKFSS